MSKTTLHPLPRIAVAIACTLAVAGGAAAQSVEDPIVQGKAIIRVAAGVLVVSALQDLNEAAAPLGVSFSINDGDSLADRDLYLLNYEPKDADTDQLEIVLDNPPASLVWGELLYADHDPEGHTGSIWFHSVGGLAAYENQYAATELGLPQAGKLSVGSGVTVAVLDTGIDPTHPVLSGSVAAGGVNFITGNGDTNDDGLGASAGHGTFVASLIHLVAPEAQLLPIVVLDSDGVGDLWSLALGMFYAIDQGVDVINLSLGSTYDSLAILEALSEATSLGIVVFAAGGNQGALLNLREYPASFDEEDLDCLADETWCRLGIAAVDDADVKWPSSNYHPEFFVSAPGANGVIGALPLTLDDYGDWSGTSFATAFVSGTAALIRAQHPDWPLPFMIPQDIAQEIKSVIAISSVPIDDLNPGFETQLGEGRVDAGAAVMAMILFSTGDLDADGVIGIVDFLTLLEAWGPCVGVCRADLDADGFVGLTDFLALLANWG